jgi:three-Cys-motif partner protein
MSSGENLHPDEINAVESRAQTEHKLEIMRRYFGTFASILAQSKSPRIDNSHIWLVDLFSGTGLHRSSAHPDGRVLGTALQACAAARNVQMRHPHSQVHVRLVDLEHDYCEKLRDRAQFFQAQGVDVAVIESDYADAVGPICAEIRSHATSSRSLWLVDPHGPKILSFNSLRPILGFEGVELVINLDVTGVNRMRGVALSEKAALDTAVAELARKNRANLDALYRGNYWEKPELHIRVRPAMTMEARLAEAYLLPFRTFINKKAYALRTSDSQYRYLVHLTKSTIGEQKFAEDYAASQRIGYTKGKALSESDCATHAQRLFAVYRGSTPTLEEIYADQVVTLDRGQLGRVLRYASNDGYGDFDGEKMAWRDARVDQLPLPPRSAAIDDQQMKLF